MQQNISLLDSLVLFIFHVKKSFTRPQKWMHIHGSMAPFCNIRLMKKTYWDFNG